MAIIRINQKLERLEVKDFEIDNKIVFNFFDRLPESERDDNFLRAIYIGVLALMEDRISTFLSKTSNELGTELESLKLIFDMKNELFFKSTVKGVLAEEDIADFLITYLKERKISDKVYLTGNTTGLLQKNKTGDIVAELNGNSGIKIVIECKFDKSMRLGDIESKEVFTRKTDSAWSQLVEAQANRDSKVSIIVFDVSLADNSITKQVDNLGYIPSIGFISIINSQKGDYTNLAIAYMLARDIALNSKSLDIDFNILQAILKRIIKDINEIKSIRTLVEGNIQNNKLILKQLEKSVLLMDFNQQYLAKFLREGTLNKKDLLDFYMGEEIKDKFKLIEKEIEGL
jgi:hypothetical protein